MVKRIRCPGCNRAIDDDGAIEFSCPECRARFDRSTLRTPRARLAPAATALMLVGGLGIFGSCLLGIATISAPPHTGKIERPPGMTDEAFEMYEQGAGASFFLTVNLTACSIIFVYPVVLLGGWRMTKCQNYWLALLSALFALLPCGLVWLVSAPVGLWAISLLLRRDIRSAFYENGS